MKLVWILYTTACLVAGKNSLRAAETAALPAIPAMADPTEWSERNLTALKGVMVPLTAAKAELDRLREEREITNSVDQKVELQARVDAENERVQTLRENFREIVGGSESAGYEEIKEVSKTLQDQVSDLLDPLVGALREPTEELRKTEQMRKKLAKWKDRYEKAQIVIRRIEGIQKKASDPQVEIELQSAKTLWQGRLSDATGQIQVLGLQVDERERSTLTFWEKLSAMFRDFWRTRGLNLMLALLVAVAGYVLTRWLYQMMRRALPVIRDGRNFASRAAAIISVIVAVLVSLLGIVLVFYLRGDWLLLTLIIVLLIGVAWAGKTALPPYVAQIRMLLNLGAVREGERLIYQELPWEVTKLGFYTIFTNPALEGGVLRVPLKMVMKMISRPPDAKEQWFPSHVNDWVKLSGGTYGKVIHQTPEQVVLLKLGGSLKTYPVADFLKERPENLSHGFRVSGQFGIDYTHQAEATTRVCELFLQGLETAFHEAFGRDVVRSVKVEFASAASSSLDYAILADFTGEAASKVNQIARMIQKACVNVCNEHGWGIPFPQLTVHQAKEDV